MIDDNVILFSVGNFEIGANLFFLSRNVFNANGMIECYNDMGFNLLFGNSLGWP